MSRLICQQYLCSRAAAYRFTWPGERSALVCQYHSHKVKNLSSAMGWQVDLVPITMDAVRRDTTPAPPPDDDEGQE
jgi:hypothetical protein